MDHSCRAKGGHVSPEEEPERYRHKKRARGGKAVHGMEASHRLDKRKRGGKLTAEDRHAMPKKEFAGPGESFPVNDKKHARLAISGATRSERAGNISPSTEAHIKAKARRKLGSGD